MRHALVMIGATVLALLLAACQPGAPPAFTQPEAALPILDMDSVHHKPGTFGDPAQSVGTVEVVEGKFEGACKFSFVPKARSGFFQAGVKATPEWDTAAGLSFWVKGDGSDSWGGLELIDKSDYALRYAYCFPIKSTQWEKIVVPWRDLIPELPAGKPVAVPDGYKPAGFGNLWFGKWYYWQGYPAHSYTIDEIRLEPKIALRTGHPLPQEAGTPRLLVKLKAAEPVTIVTMGDSLSDQRHWANREVLWSQLLAEQLKQKYGSEVTLVNPAIGGTQLTQNLVLMPRWLSKTPHSDLVTVWFGYNDWDSGMRGEHFKRMLRLAVDRIRRMTDNSAEVMLITTLPSVERWNTMDELAQAVRSAAQDKRTGLADVAAAAHTAGADEEARLDLYCWDRVHLGESGHRLVAETVMNALK